jgi:hypothetical protein
MHDERVELLGRAQQAVERGDHAEAHALAAMALADTVDELAERMGNLNLIAGSPQPRYLTYRGAAEHLGTTPAGLRKRVELGEIPHITVADSGSTGSTSTSACVDTAPMHGRNARPPVWHNIGRVAAGQIPAGPRGTPPPGGRR